MATELTDRKALFESRASIIKSLVNVIQIHHDLSFTNIPVRLGATSSPKARL